jgi:hypothetical protein
LDNIAAMGDRQFGDFNKTLNALPEELRKKLNAVADNAAKKFGNQGRCTVAFFFDELQVSLDAIRASLLDAMLEIQEADLANEEAILTILTRLEFEEGLLSPVICDGPTSLIVTWNDNFTKVQNAQWVDSENQRGEMSGYGVGRFKDEKRLWKLRLLKKQEDDGAIENAHQHMVFHGDFALTLKLADIQFKRSADVLELSFADGDKSLWQANIDHIKANEPKVTGAYISFFGDEKVPTVAFDIELGVVGEAQQLKLREWVALGEAERVARDIRFGTDDGRVTTPRPLKSEDTVYLHVSMSERRGGEVLYEYRPYGQTVGSYRLATPPNTSYARTVSWAPRIFRREGFLADGKNYIRRDPIALVRDNWKGRFEIVLVNGGQKLLLQTEQIVFRNGKTENGDFTARLMGAAASGRLTVDGK